MTINYTNLLGLAKPVTGTETGQWGDVVNDQITELVEDAVANASSISVTSGDVTLTTTTGSANQARMSTLIITGSPGVTRNVIAPSQAKTYVVINQSNASVVIKGAATTGVTLLASEKASVAWNGSDFVKIATQSGNGDFVTVDTTNLEVTNIKAKDGTAAASIADSTGIISITSNPILSGGTANGVLYLNGSKVATSGSALTFDGSQLVIDSLGEQLKLTRTTVGSGTLNIGGSGELAYASGFHIWFNAAKSTEWMRLDSSGNLGLGVTPTNVASYTNLEVRGSTGGLFYTSNSNGSVKGYFGNTASVVFLNAITNHPLTFGTNDTERARITSDGNFLVGTTTSNTKFVVGATTQTGAESSVYTSATSGGDSSRFSFWRNYTVGSSSPFRAAYISNINIDDSFNSNNNQCIGFFTKSGTSEPAERARITGGGNLLVGTTTDLSSSYAYQVGSARSGGFYSEAGGTGDAGFASVSNAILYHFYCASTTQSKFYVENDGDAFNRNGTYGTISDIKHKQDVIDAPSQWDDLKAIRFRKYRMKSDVQTNPDAPYLLGVVAQELEQVSPGLVSEDPDFETKEVTDEDGNVTTKKVQVGITKTVKSSILLMKAAVALQEAMTRIEQLEAKVAALESKGV